MKYNQSIFIYSFIFVFIIISTAVFNSVYVYKFFNRNAFISETLSHSRGEKAQAAIKFFYAQSRRKPFDIGIFGNSRSFMISEADFDLKDGKTFFNFSIGGSAFVQSVRLVEKLASEGLAPKTILVSLDHPQIQYTGYVKYPNPVFHITDIVADFLNMANAEIGSRQQRFSDAVKVLDWAKDHTWNSFKNAWKRDVLIDRLNYVKNAVLDRKLDLPLKRLNFRDDGSIVQVLPSKMTNFSNQKFGYGGLRGWDRHVYLGIKRLGVVARKYSVRIIVYESPIWPGLAGSDKYIRKDAISTHRWFVNGCLETVIECINAWKLESQDSGYWPDCCHAPAGDLGYYFRTQLLIR